MTTVLHLVVLGSVVTAMAFGLAAWLYLAHWSTRR
jgi:hypothetical protein